MKHFRWIYIVFYFYVAILAAAEECTPKIDLFCYSYFNSTKGFTEAESACREFHNGHLASLHDVFTNDIVGDYAIKYNINKFWIGGNQLADPDKWTWTDGSDFDFTSWAQGEPDLLPGYLCIFMDTSTKLWYTNDCFKNLSYVCKYSSADFSTAVPGSSGATVSGVGSSVTVVTGATSSTGVTGGVTSVTGVPSPTGVTGIPITGGGSSSGTVSAGVTSAPPGTQTSISSSGTGGPPSNSPSTNSPPPSASPSTSTQSPVSTSPPSTLPSTTTTASSGTVCEFGWIYFEGTHSCYKNTTNKYSLDDAEKVCVSAGAKLTSIENDAEYGFLNRTMEYFYYWIGLCSTDNSVTWNWIDGKSFTYRRWCQNAPFKQPSSCAVTSPTINCFTNLQKTSKTYGMCKKAAINLLL